MKENTVDQGLAVVPSQPPRRMLPWRILSVVLLLSLVFGAYAALNFLVPSLPNSTRETSSLGWYLHNGQPKADALTLAAAFRYVIGTESDKGTVEKISNPSVAEHAAPTSPKS